MTIGIPRALFHWKQPYFWQTFFEKLGFKVVLSPETNQEILKRGIKVADSETCFSTKVFWGHLLWLEEKSDWIFVPRLKAKTDKLEYCPRFFGLPDLAKILVKTPILTQTFDERKESFKKTLERLGKKLNKNKEEIKKAIEIAFSVEEELKVKTEQNFFKKIQAPEPKIILISHPYILYDEYVNLRIKEKLEKLGAQVIFIDEVPISVNQRNNPHKSATTIKFHWEFGKEIMKQIAELFWFLKSRNSQIAGAIEISSFQCGCDAVLKEFVEKEFKSKKIHFLYLMVDEQTGEAGLQTRLEAFIDTL